MVLWSAGGHACTGCALKIAARLSLPLLEAALGHAGRILPPGLSRHLLSCAVSVIVQETKPSTGDTTLKLGPVL